ncbi:DNA-directed DNA polymerase [Rhodotorula kratochvilovae]
MPAPTAVPQGHAAKHSVLPLFPLLASHNPATRLDAAAQLVHALPLLSTSDDADTPYALKRLVAGLASSNDAARQGFAVALAQLVALLPADSHQVRRILPQVVEQTTPKAGADAREERDLLFARLMGLHALVRSGVLVRPDSSAAGAEGDNWKETVGALVSLANKKTWIREPSYWVICEALRALCDAPDALAWKADALQWAVQRLVGDAREKARGFSPEKVAVVLVLQAHNVDADWASLLAPTFPSGSLLSRSSLSALASALRGASSSASSPFDSATPKQGSNSVKTAKGPSAPAAGQAPHFVWTLLADTYFPSSASPAPSATDRVPFPAFWAACVDHSLFASSSLPLKALGFSLFSLFLSRATAADVPALLSPHALRVLANHLRRETSGSGGEKTLARVADKLVVSTLPAFFAASEANRAAALPALKKLVAAPDSQYNAFEPKVLERIVARLNVAGVRGWVAHLRGVILAPAVDAAAADEGADAEETDAVEDAQAREKRLTAQRNWAFDQLLFVVRNGSVEKDDEVVTGLLEFLAVVGWFEINKEGSKGARSYVPSTPLTPAHRAAARTRFFSILASLLSAPAPLGGSAWLARALALLDNLAADAKHFARPAGAAAEEDDDEAEAEGAAYDVRLRELYPALAGTDAPAPAARALVEGVRLVAWDEGRDDAADVLEGAVDAVEALFPALSAADADDDEDEDEEKPEPATVVMDVLLALLRRPSAFVKAFAGPVVLKGLAEQVGLQAVELLRDVVAPEDDEPEAEQGDAEKSAAGKGKKEAEASADEEESDDDSDDSDDDSDDEDGADFEVDEAFKNELLAALEAGGMAVPGASADDEDDEMRDDGEEELLDDEAMLELDDKLADIFRANGGGKSKKRDRQDDLHYRLRCLDLLDVLAHTKAASALLIPLYVPLFNLIRTASATESELQTKAGKLLRFLVQPRKSADAAALVEPSDESSHAALEALEDLHRAAASTDAPTLAPLCAQVAVALVKAAVSLAPAASRAHAQEHVARVTAQSFEKYLTTKNAKTRVQPALTSEVAKRAPAAAWGALPRVVELASGGAKGDGEKVNAFRRMQAFEVAQVLFTSYASLKTPESKAAVLAAIPSYRAALFAALSTSLTSASASAEFDASRLKLLAKQALAAARLTVSLSSQTEAATLWRPQEWSGLVADAGRSDRFKGAVGVITLVKQLVGVLGVAVDGGEKAAKKDKKRKADPAVAAVKEQGTPAKKAKASLAKGTPASAAKGKKAAAAPTPAPAPAAAAANPESEVQDESVEDDAAADESMAVDGAEAQDATPSKKKSKKDKKRRRESAGKA